MKYASTLFFLLFSVLLQAQIRDVPKEVRDAFEKQYPMARNPEYKDLLATIHVNFNLDSLRYVAKYTPKGIWRETEQASSFDKMPIGVKDGFMKSKYTDWDRTEAAILQLPGNVTQYRIKVEKRKGLQRKYLFYDITGKLIRDAITI